MSVSTNFTIKPYSLPETTQNKALAIPIHPEQPSFNKKGYIKLAATISSITAIQAFINGLIGNDFGIKAGKNGMLLASDMIVAGFNGKALKGLWFHNRNFTQQGGALAANIAVAIIFDSIVYAIPYPIPVRFPVGQATAIATANSFGLLCKTAAYRVVNESTSRLSTAEYDTLTTKQRRLREGFNGVVIGTIGATVAIATRSLDINNALAVALSTAYSQATGKLTKVSWKKEETIANKVTLLFIYLMIAVAMDVSVGAAYSRRDGQHTDYNDVLRYLGPVSALSFLTTLSLLVKTRVNKEVATETTPTEVETAQPKKPKSPTKKIVAFAIASSVVKTSALIGHHLNNHQSAIADLALKVLQSNFDFNFVRGFYKLLGGDRNNPNVKKQIISLAAQLAFAATIELSARAINPPTQEETGVWNLPVTAIAAGTGAAFLGKIIRGQLLPKQV